MMAMSDTKPNIISAPIFTFLSLLCPERAKARFRVLMILNDTSGINNPFLFYLAEYGSKDNCRSYVLGNVH